MTRRPSPSPAARTDPWCAWGTRCGGGRVPPHRRFIRCCATWNAPPDRPRRLRIFCDAYGWEDAGDILGVMAHRIEVMIATGLAKHAAGDPLYGEFWMTVLRQRLLRDIAFIRTQHPV